MKDKQTVTSVALSPRHRQMLKEIGDKTGDPSLAGAIKYAIFFAHSNLYKDYLIKPAKTPRKQLSPMELEQQKIDRQKAKIKLLEQEKMKIVDKLGGTVFEDEYGNKNVRWFTYWTKGKDEQQLPLMSMSEELVSNQFQGGSIEDIKKFHNLK